MKNNKFYDSTEFYVYHFSDKAFSNLKKDASKTLKSLYPYKFDEKNIIVKYSILKRKGFFALYLGSDVLQKFDKPFVKNAISVALSKNAKSPEISVEKITLKTNQMRKNRKTNFLLIFMILVLVLFVFSSIGGQIYKKKKNELAEKQKREREKTEILSSYEAEQKVEIENLEKKFMNLISEYPMNPYFVFMLIFSGKEQDFCIDNITIKGDEVELEMETKYFAKFFAFLEEKTVIDFVELKQVVSSSEKQKCSLVLSLKELENSEILDFYTSKMTIDEKKTFLIEKNAELEKNLQQTRYTDYSSFLTDFTKMVKKHNIEEFSITSNKVLEKNQKTSQSDFLQVPSDFLQVNLTITSKGKAKNILDFFSDICKKNFVSSATIFNFQENENLRLTVNLVLFLEDIVHSSPSSQFENMIILKNMDFDCDRENNVSLCRPVESLFYTEKKKNKVESNVLNNVEQNDKTPKKVESTDFSFLLIATNKGNNESLIVKKNGGQNNGRIYKVTDFEEFEKYYQFDLGGKKCGVKK